MATDPISHELALSRHIDSGAGDLDLGGVVEPHSKSVLADPIDQSI